jgi:hypothetical protein
MISEVGWRHPWFLRIGSAIYRRPLLSPHLVAADDTDHARVLAGRALGHVVYESGGPERRMGSQSQRRTSLAEGLPAGRDPSSTMSDPSGASDVIDASYPLLPSASRVGFDEGDHAHLSGLPDAPPRREPAVTEPPSC